MTQNEIKAFWQGIAAANVGNVMLTQIVSEDGDDVNYILPSIVNTGTIQDGFNANVIIYAFTCEKALEYMPVFTTIGITVTTAFDIFRDIYCDCDLTITYTLDDVVVKTAYQTYSDGDHILNADLMLESIGLGDHVLVINIAAEGGIVS